MADDVHPPLFDLLIILSFELGVNSPFVCRVIDWELVWCYNYDLATRSTMPDLHKQITQHLLQIQTLLEDADLGEHDSIQTAFNALVCAVDDELIAD